MFLTNDLAEYLVNKFEVNDIRTYVRYSTTGSIYIHLDYNQLGVIRISDHYSVKHSKEKYQLLSNVDEIKRVVLNVVDNQAQTFIYYYPFDKVEALANVLIARRNMFISKGGKESYQLRLEQVKRTIKFK